jgi:hypothetical protein
LISRAHKLGLSNKTDRRAFHRSNKMTPGVVVMISFILIAILGVATWGGARLFRSYRAGHAAVFSAFLRIVF